MRRCCLETLYSSNSLRGGRVPVTSQREIKYRMTQRNKPFDRAKIQTRAKKKGEKKGCVESLCDP
jgi:hypothetical protein